MTAIGRIAVVVAAAACCVTSAHATLVCEGNYLVIKCPSGKTVKCHDNAGYQVDCNGDNEASKCALVGGIAPTPCDVSGTIQGVCCPSGAVVGCYSQRPPANPANTCGVPDTLNLTNCSENPYELCTAAAQAEAVPGMPPVGQAALALILLCSGAYFSMKRRGNDARSSSV